MDLAYHRDLAAPSQAQAPKTAWGYLNQRGRGSRAGEADLAKCVAKAEPWRHILPSLNTDEEEKTDLE